MRQELPGSICRSACTRSRLRGGDVARASSAGGTSVATRHRVTFEHGAMQ